MKYLFFFNGQLLLLCCICCKIAIQDFVTRLHKKNKKNLRFHRRTITRRYFTELKTNYRSVPQSPTAYNPSVFHREFKKNYGSVPQSPTDLPMVLPKYITDGLTDEIPTPRTARMSDTCLSCRCTDGSKSLEGFMKFFGAHLN